MKYSKCPHCGSENGLTIVYLTSIERAGFEPTTGELCYEIDAVELHFDFKGKPKNQESEDFVKYGKYRTGIMVFNSPVFCDKCKQQISSYKEIFEEEN